MSFHPVKISYSKSKGKQDSLISSNCKKKTVVVNYWLQQLCEYLTCANLVLVKHFVGG